MTIHKLALGAAAAALTCALALPALAGEPLYRLKSATTLPSTNTDWDYLKIEPGGSRLFIARRKDGLTVFDVATNKVIATLANSVGANGPLLVPQFNRGYVGMTDGSLLSFDLKTLAVIDRTPLADDGGLNGIVFDAATSQIHAVTGPRPERSTWFTLDAATGKLLKKTAFPFKKMDDPSPTGKGHIFAPARYDQILMKLDSKTLAEQERWTLKDCTQVVAVEYQASTNRVLVACRGPKPVFMALDADTGRVVAQTPIGAGVDGLGVDEHRHRIVASNGDATLSVIAQDGPDAYRWLGNVMTRPLAKNMQMDEHTGRVFLITADHTVSPPDEKGVTPLPTFHPDTFVVLAYEPQ